MKDRVISALVGCVVTAGFMYVTVLGNYATKTEVRQIVAVESPYVKDQKWLTEKIRSVDDRLGKLDDKLNLVLDRLPKP